MRRHRQTEDPASIGSLQNLNLTGITAGIDAIALAVPQSYVALDELAAARGVPASKYLSGLGTQRMCVAAPHEDPVTLAADAARRVLRLAECDPSEIGLCIVGTETAVDHSKPIAAFLHGLLGLRSACRVFETKHACFGGTAGVLNALDWIGSGSARGRAALVVCSDIARYAIGSAGEPTQGAGAVAMILRADPRLVALEVGRSGSYARDVYDFWRPLDRNDAVVDGHFSVFCYLDALAGAYDDWRRGADRDDDALARTCYHVPYGKMARKAHRHRRMMDGLTEAEADGTFALEVEPSLALPAQVGNIYTGSLYLALASLLHAEPDALAGRRVGLFSYGSGCTAEFFAGRVTEEAPSLVRRLDIDGPLRDCRRISVAEYEKLRRSEIAADRRPAPESTGLGRGRPGGGVSFLGIDDGERRIYGERKVTVS
jgi:hydroxymethylglutaryl-CoA synthase